MSILVNFEIFPKDTFVKLIFLVLFLGFNAYFLIRGVRDIRTNYPIKMSLVRKLFQNELGLENHELFSINDTLNNIEVQNSEQQEYWNKFISSIKTRVDKKYSFKLKYFFLNDKILDGHTKISLIGWIFFSYFMLDQNFYKNFETSISFEKQQQMLTLDYSMNVLIYAPDEAKNPIVYIDNKYNERASDKEIFLIKKNSKILMNFYNLRRKDIKIKIKNNDKIKFLENIKIIDSTTFQLEDLVENGEYIIYLKNKIFQKFTLEIDKKPMINFISQPKLTEDFRLLFKYELIDENNLLTLIELSRSLKDLVREKGLNQDSYNKTNTNPINYIILSNGIREKKAKKYSFKEDIRHLPISGGNIYLKLTSFDKNEQLGTSKVKKLYLPEKIFQDSFAKEIIRIRESVFNGTKIKKIIMQIERENILNHSLEINQIIESLIYYINRKEIGYEDKKEALVNGLWRVANIIEVNSIDKLVRNIEKLKLEIENLLDQNIEGDELLEKMNQLEKLINKYMSLKKEKTKSSDDFLDNDYIEEDEELNNKSKNLNDRAKSLLEKAENLFNEKDSEVNNNILKEIQKLYKKQKKLIDDTYSKKNLSKAQREDLSLKQKQVFDLFSILREDLLKIISSEGMFIKKIEERFIQIIESFDRDSHEDLVKREIDILNNLKELYNKIKKKTDTNKIKKESKNENSNQKNYNDGSNFDTPIIFESNSFKQIIEIIRKMTNDENRHDKEKEYLKRLLPNF